MRVSADPALVTPESSRVQVCSFGARDLALPFREAPLEHSEE